MIEFGNFENAVASLGGTITDFSTGILRTLEESKPVDEQYRITKERLKHLNTRLLRFKVQREYQQTVHEPKEDVQNTVKGLHEATARTIINNNVIKLHLYSRAIQAILTGKGGDPNKKQKVDACLKRLFTLNDRVMSLQKEIEEASRLQLSLKVECQKELYEYEEFLKERDKYRKQKLQETNPTVAMYKQRTYETIRKINILKRLMTSLIAASQSLLLEKPVLVEMLEKHREFVTYDTIMKTIQDEGENENETNE